MLLIDCRYEKADYNPSEKHTEKRERTHPFLLQLEAMKGKLIGEKSFQFFFATSKERSNQEKPGVLECRLGVNFS